jgi:hypothetical protein
MRWLVLALLLASSATGQTLLSADAPTYPAGFAVVGAGATTTGGTGKPTVTITTLNPTGAGSITAALASCAATDGCSVVYASGLNGYTTLTDNFVWNVDNTTFDGTTDTNEGMAFRNYALKLYANNLIFRNVRMRGSATNNEDCWTLSGWNIVLDHVSALWCSDENINITNHQDVTHGPSGNITVQHSIFGEPSDDLAAGSTRQTLIGEGVAGPITLYRNVLTRSTDRSCWKISADDEDPLPEIDSLSVQIIENVCYDFIYGSLSSASTGNTLNIDYLRNVFKRGPSRVGEPATALEKFPIMLQDYELNPSPNDGQVFIFGEGNVLMDNESPGFAWSDIASLTGEECDSHSTETLNTPCAFPTDDCAVEPCGQDMADPLQARTAALGSQFASGDAILRQVLSEAGPACLETAEARTLNEVRTGTRSGPFPLTTGDYPTLTGSCQ